MDRIKYRHEFKYIVSNSEAKIVTERMKRLMSFDRHTDETHKYRIRSVYFDDFRNSCLTDNEAGVDPRKKYRVRIYNGSADVIHLECKYKICGKTYKDSVPLNYETALVLLRGQYLRTISNQPGLLASLTAEMMKSWMKPVCIVDYERTPFVCPNGNVRITVDENISGSCHIDSFFSGQLVAVPVLAPGMCILEVKFDEFIPDHIYSALQLDNLENTSFSKYYFCRKALAQYR